MSRRVESGRSESESIPMLSRGKTANLAARPVVSSGEGDLDEMVKGQIITARIGTGVLTALVVITAIIVVGILEGVQMSTADPKPLATGSVNVVISSNLPFLGFSFSVYPIDITYCTFLMVLGVVAFCVAVSDYGGDALYESYTTTNDHWMTLSYSTFATGSIAYLLAQVRSRSLSPATRTSLVPCPWSMLKHSLCRSAASPTASSSSPLALWPWPRPSSSTSTISSTMTRARCA